MTCAQIKGRLRRSIAPTRETVLLRGPLAHESTPFEHARGPLPWSRREPRFVGHDDGGGTSPAVAIAGPQLAMVIGAPAAQHAIRRRSRPWWGRGVTPKQSRRSPCSCGPRRVRDRRHPSQGPGQRRGQAPFAGLDCRRQAGRRRWPPSRRRRRSARRHARTTRRARRAGRRCGHFPRPGHDVLATRGRHRARWARLLMSPPGR